MITFRQPFQGSWPITQRYGVVVPGVTYKDRPHTGIDYACPEGTPILASADGTVVYSAFDTTGYGKVVIIQHKDGRATLYAHLLDRNVTPNQTVKQGDVIGHSGNTGNSTGPHLHFEARKQWNDWRSHFDPMELPLMSFADAGKTSSELVTNCNQLKGADQLGEDVKVVALDGARRFNSDWTFPYPGAYTTGQKLHFTGRTAKREGYPYTYCEVYEEPQKYWVAVNDGVTQILDNEESPGQ